MFGDYKAYPPGPWNINAPIGLTWRHAVAYWWNPLTFFSRMGRYGDLAFFRLFGARGYLVNRPDLICEVLIHRRTEFAKWQHQMRPLRQLMGDSLLTTEGPQWAEQRQLMQQAFTQAAVDRYQSVAHEDAEQEFASLGASQRFDLVPLLLKLLIRINLRSLFGVSDMSTGQDLMWAIRSLSDVFQAEMFEPLPLPQWLPLKYKRHRRQAVKILDREVDRVLAAADCTDTLHVGSVLRKSSASSAGALSYQQRRMECVTLMIAGFHTTSEMLVWVVRTLANHPDVQQRVVDECRADPSPSDKNSNDYLDQVIKESLRLYPSAWSLFARQAVEDTILAGYPIRRGSVIFIAPWVTHRDARYYPDPLRFDPDRFLPDSENARAKGTYFPFGLGPHVCIGAATATRQVREIVMSLLRRFHIQAVNSGRHAKLSANLALRCNEGLIINMTQRNRSCPVASASLNAASGTSTSPVGRPS